MNAVDWLETEYDVGKTSYGTVHESAGGNDTVPISVVVCAVSSAGFRQIGRAKFPQIYL